MYCVEDIHNTCGEQLNHDIDASLLHAILVVVKEFYSRLLVVRLWIAAIARLNVQAHV